MSIDSASLGSAGIQNGRKRIKTTVSDVLIYPGLFRGRPKRPKGRFSRVVDARTNCRAIVSTSFAVLSKGVLFDPVMPHLCPIGCGASINENEDQVRKKSFAGHVIVEFKPY